MVLQSIGNWWLNLIGVRRDDSNAYKDKPKSDPNPRTTAPIPPGRVSVSNDTTDMLSVLKGEADFVTPSFRTEIIPLIRSLYKVNPDVGIAVQDMFKLGNTKHFIEFPHNTPEEALKMRKHLQDVSKTWSNYTAGIFGLVNKMFVQMLVSGAMSMEAVPKKDLSGIESIIFIKPEDIVFQRDQNGKYRPYQLNKTWNHGN